MVHAPKLLELVELKLREVISREPTLLVVVVGIPNVGKSALINSIHQIATSRFPGKILLSSYHYYYIESSMVKPNKFSVLVLKKYTLRIDNYDIFHSAGEDEKSYCWTIAWCYSRYCGI